MFDFRQIELSDKDRVNACLAASDFRGCEYCFANNLAWRKLADTLIAFEDDFYISCSFYGEDPVFTFPCGVETDESGREKYLALFEKLKKFAENQGRRFTLCSVSAENLPWIREAYGSRISVTADRDSFDYIYKSEDLIGLSGKKYHGKRNHIKRFKEHEWSFKLITPEDFDECTSFAALFYNEAYKNDFSSAVEQYAIHTYFENFEYLGLIGGALYCDGEMAGFTLGERLNSDTFDVHIEKARADIQGAYPTLCNEFAKAAAAEFRYINREEDLGLEGLRKSKLSYKPEFLQEKYTVSF
jgi:hypothetical protein